LQHKADSENSDTGDKVLAAQGWFYNFRSSCFVETFVGHVLWARQIKVTYINEFCGCLFSWCGPDCQSESYIAMLMS